MSENKQTEVEAESETVKVKEDAIRVMEANLLDTFNCIEAEIRKSSYALLFASGLMAFIVGMPQKTFPCGLQFILTILYLCSVVPALCNMVSKKVVAHLDIDSVFKIKDSIEWEDYLDKKHPKLNKCYNSAKQAVESKAYCNKISFASIALLTLVAVVANLLAWINP